MNRRRTKILVGFVAIAGVLGLFCAFLWPKSQNLPRVTLADGRILQVEAVTYGLKHGVGFKSPLENFRPWIPSRIYSWLDPKYPRSEMRLDDPCLVVWVNAIDPATGKHVDCQGIRMEILGEGGDVFGQQTSGWFGGTSFWRVGHVFNAYPRAQRSLTLQITPWQTNVSVRVLIPNPEVVQPATWVGQPPPQQQLVGDMEIVLKELLLRTNGSPTKYWESPTRFWSPEWELRKDKHAVSGWEEPEWTAEDPTGNKGRYLGTHQPVMRYSARFYPTATNEQAAVLLGTSAPFELQNLQSNIWWGLSLKHGQSRVEVLGVFTKGMHTFLEGAYQSNPPPSMRMGPTRGGAPSGWVGISRRVSPTHVEEWAGHYTPVPVIYLKLDDSAAKERLGVRLRDEQGRCWVAKRESDNAQGVVPFLLEAPEQLKNVAAEVVLLPPLEAQFLVRVPPAPAETQRSSPQAESH